MTIAALFTYWFVGYVRALRELKVEAGRDCAELKEWLEAEALKHRKIAPGTSDNDRWKFVYDVFEYKGKSLPTNSIGVQPWRKSDMYALFKEQLLSTAKVRAALWFWPSSWTLRGKYFEQGEAQYAELKRLQEIITSENLDPYNIIDWETLSCGKR